MRVYGALPAVYTGSVGDPSTPLHRLDLRPSSGPHADRFHFRAYRSSFSGNFLPFRVGCKTNHREKTPCVSELFRWWIGWWTTARTSSPSAPFWRGRLYWRSCGHRDFPSTPTQGPHALGAPTSTVVQGGNRRNAWQTGAKEPGSAMNTTQAHTPGKRSVTWLV